MKTGAFCIKVREQIRIRSGGNLYSELRIGSHSCKKTILGWCSKAGLKIGIRRILGYHLKSGEGSTIVYSRDAVAGPIREMLNVLSAISDGRFRPDETRSGRWVQEAEDEVHEGIFEDFQHIDVPDSSTDEEGFGKTQHRCVCGAFFKNHEELVFCAECQTNGCGQCMPMVRDVLPKVCYTCFHQDVDRAVEEEVAEAGSSSGSDSFDSSSSEEEADAAAEKVALALVPGQIVGIVLGRRAAGNVDDTVVQHIKIKTLHLCNELGEQVLACGRRFNKDTHQVLRTFPVFEYPRCKDCFGTVQE